MESQKCPNCGSDIDDDDPQGLCPSCLLKETIKLEASEPALPFSAEGDAIRHALEEKLRSQYRIIRMLGRGGMGAVYLARDLTLDREVAIKVVSTSTDSRERYDRFRREAKTAAKLSHPNIVPLHAFGEIEGMPYFVMGYVRGESLAARLRREGRIAEEEARRVIGEIAQALDHAHRLGVVHRDVKPDNVLLDDETGRALLTDFGLAKAINQGDTLTRLGGVVGTPHFMSPEQASGHDAVDARSDIYSLGVMGYAMLAGRLPFEGSTAADILAKHLTQDPPPLRVAAPSVSDTTVQAVERCLAKDPAARWQDARSLAQAIGATEIAHLPESLHAVDGVGIVALILGFLWLDAFYLAGSLAVRALRDEGEIGFLQRLPIDSLLTHVLFVLVPWALYYAHTVNKLRREGFSLEQSQGVIWREPTWWIFWYPRSGRRGGNVWNRLPAPVRRFRLWNTIVANFVVLGVVLFVAFGTRALVYGQDVSNDSPFSERLDAVNVVTMSSIAVILVSWFLFRSQAMRELKRHGLGSLDASRVLLTVPLNRNSFWGRPHIAATLAPAGKTEQPRVDSPHEHLQAILRYGNELSGALRPLGAQAAVAARQLVAAIDQSNKQIADLMSSIEPGEEERLADKIAALQGDDYAPIRTLLEKQLELIRELSARLEEAKERRNRRVEMIKMLSLHLASLRARVTETPSEVRQLSDDVRALCDEIGRHGATSDIGGEMQTVQKM
jgi:hypothetical protein